jgi:hypothetical protein
LRAALDALWGVRYEAERVALLARFGAVEPGLYDEVQLLAAAISDSELRAQAVALLSAPPMAQIEAIPKHSAAERRALLGSAYNQLQTIDPADRNAMLQLIANSPAFQPPCMPAEPRAWLTRLLIASFGPRRNTKEYPLAWQWAER